MNIVVTGASRGIGKGIAEVLSRRGHALGLLARNTSQLEQLVSRLSSSGKRCFFAECDLRSPDQTFAAIGKLYASLGRIDALVNNAGRVIRKNALEISLEEWHTLIETNVNGVFYAARAVLPLMKEQGAGHIVNISSISGKVPLPGGSGYAASKYAVTGFSESLLQEVRDYNIKVSTVFPGSVDTESHRGDESDNSWKLTPEQIGESIAHLLETSETNCISQLEIRPLRRRRSVGQ